MLSRLKWDISSVTPHDFLELLLSRLPIKNKKFPEVNTDKIRKHAQAYISLAARGENTLKLINFAYIYLSINIIYFLDHIGSMYSASAIAASAIAASLNGIHWHIRCGVQIIDLINRLTDLTGIEQVNYYCFFFLLF